MRRTIPPRRPTLARGRPRTTPRAVIGPWLRLGLEAFSVILAACFLCSMIVNALVFWSWRLSFPQLASASDVVNSGLQLIWAVSLAGALAGLGAGAYQVLCGEVPLSWRKRASAAFKIVVAAVALASAIGVALDVARQPEKAGQLDIWLAPYTLLAFAVGYGATEKAALASGPHDARVRQALNDVFLIIGGVSLILLLANMNFVAHFGFLGSPYQVTKPELPKDCEGRVLWSGERAIVVRCAPGVRPTVIIGPENAILVPIVEGQGLKHAPAKP